MVADGAVRKLRHGSSQFFSLAREEPACGALIVKVKNTVKQAELHHEASLAQPETRPDAVAAHGIIVTHRNQVPLVVVEQLMVKRRVVVVRQDKVLLVTRQLVGICRFAEPLHVVSQKQVGIEDIKLHIIDDTAAVSSKNHQRIVHQIGLSSRKEIEERTSGNRQGRIGFAVLAPCSPHPLMHSHKHFLQRHSQQTGLQHIPCIV